MDKYIIIIAAFALSLSTAYSQGDSTRYINGLPVSDDDTVQNFPARDLPPNNNLRPLSINELPSKLVEALDDDPLYRGWRDTTVYLQVNTGLYQVPVKYEEGIKIFGMNKNGKPVNFSEVDHPEEQDTGPGNNRE